MPNRTNDLPEGTSAVKLPVWKKLFFALLVGGLFFGVIEGVLWLFGAETMLQKEDPFRGFSKLVKVFERDGDQYRTRQDSSHRTFNDQMFAVQKPNNGFRFFTLGGSSSYGYPRGAEVAFTAILSELLAEGHPGLTIEGINASGISYGMHRLNIVADELVDYDPNLLIIYSGHNEFIEPEFYESMKNRGVAREGLEYALAQSRLYALTRSAAGRFRDTKPAGLGVGRQVRRDQTQVYTPEEKAEVVDTYREGLTRLVDRAQAAGIRVLLATIPANLQGWRPEASTGSGNNHRQWVEAQAKGRKFFKQEKYAEALASFEEAARLEPGHAETLYEVGRCCEKLGDWEKAQEAFRQACDQDASPVRRVSGINQAIREVAKAKGTLFVDVDKIFKERSEHGLVGYRLIEDYVHPTIEGHELIAWEIWRAIEQSGLLGSTGKANQQLFERITDARREATSEKDMPWFYNQGVVLENQGQIDAAIDNFRKVVEMAPRNETALLNIGKVLTKHGKAEEALPILTQVCLLAPQNPETHVSLGSALLETGDFDGAIRAIKKGLAIKSNYPNAHNSLGAALARKGQLEEAVEQFRLAIAQNPDHVAAQNNLGSALAQQGRWPEAAVAHRKAVQIDPNYVGAVENLAKALAAMQLTDQALEQYEIALQIEPNSRRARNRRIALLKDQGRLAEAAEELSILAERYPDDVLLCIQLGDLYLRIGDLAQSLQQRQRAYEMAPERIECLNNLAWLLATSPEADARDGKQAVELAARAAEATQHQNPGVLDTLAAAYAATGRYADAVKYQQQAIALAPEQAQSEFRQRLQRYQEKTPYTLPDKEEAVSP